MKSSVYTLLVVPAIVAVAEQSPPPAGQAPAALSGLRTTSERPFDTQNFQLFRGAFRCDAAGNVFFVPRLPSMENPLPFVVRVSGDGAGTVRFAVARALGGVESEVVIVSTALDSQGGLYVLADGRTEDRAFQTIVSFDEKGELGFRVELDPSEIIAHQFAVFDSGDFLLIGRRKYIREPRVAIMSASGGPLRDVTPPKPSSRGGSQWVTMDGMSFAGAAIDGSVYFVPEGGPAYGIAANGEIRRTIHLATPGPGAVLSDLKVSGGRLAAIYSSQNQQPTERWIATYDLHTGKQMGKYGPVPHIVLCYRTEGVRDQLSLLGVKSGRKLLIEVSGS